MGRRCTIRARRIADAIRDGQSQCGTEPGVVDETLSSLKTSGPRKGLIWSYGRVSEPVLTRVVNACDAPTQSLQLADVAFR